MRSPLGLGTIILAASIAVRSAAAQQAPAAAPPNCKSPEFRKLDFWVGEWDVAISQGHAGSSSVTLEEDGCVVHEHWKSVRGETGQSFNYYDRNDQKWHQEWISNSGHALHLAGTDSAGAIHYTGETVGPKGGRVMHRLSFIPDSAGRVRQLWDISTDGGKTWSTAWDGLYTRKPKN